MRLGLGGARLQVPVLLLVGSETKNPDLLGAIAKLSAALPNRAIVTLEGQEHNAMDTDRARLAAIIGAFASSNR